MKAAVLEGVEKPLVIKPVADPAPRLRRIPPRQWAA
jgi:hypothetical protein